MLECGLSLPSTPILAMYLNGRWMPGLGDRSAFGYIIIASYFSGALFSGIAWRRSRLGRGYWLALLPIMILLGICKALDLPGFVSDQFRQGFMQSYLGQFHGTGQIVVSIALLFIATVAIVFIFLIFRNKPLAVRMSASGLAYLLAFIWVRSISLHFVDHLLGCDLIGVRINHLLELGGLLLIIVPAIFINNA